ncbi:Outer membrane protein assembly factor BamB [Paraconexibacter sp. AEG42_29]|uniref:Outer membrane protein assembly factor BamB n=1 Tax=Paraconexibacter sp. AEG42_29 TaxID=2997339 RepID=A0AAU7AVA0_9ACTN
MPAHPRLRRLVLAAVVLIALVGAAAAILTSREPGDFSNPDVEFRADDTNPNAPVKPTEGSETASFTWPVYGYDKARTRYLPLAKPFRPPFAERWAAPGNVLLEFPPALGGKSLYILRDDGTVLARSRKTGRLRWRRKLGHLAASSPAYARGTLYFTLLERGKGVRAGRVVALSAKDGRTRWSRRLPSRSESSPLVDRGKLYFGSENGTVYALGIGRGKVVWTHKARGAVKGGLALDGGRLFLATYGGNVEALRPRDGKLIWRSGTSGGKFGLRSGNFYATPSAAFGRVYIGNTDGFVYSFAQSSGKLAWRKKTGNFVYSSAAVAQVPGTPPTVYVGSYDRNIYALNARTGSVIWKHYTEGRVSGGTVLLGDLLFYSTLARTTTALRAKDGKKIWFTPRGGFNPVVSTGRGIFLVGYAALYGLDGRPPKTGPQALKDRQARYRETQRKVMIRRVLQRADARNRRVAARRALIRRRNAQIAAGVKFCTRMKGIVRCRAPRPLLCAKRGSDGRTVCRPRKRP